MVAAPGREGFGEVLAAMATDRSVIDEIVSAARDASPEVARLPESETRRHVAVLLPASLALMERSGPVTADSFDVTAPALLGADRAAQGIPITALLRGVQAGRSRATEIAVARGREAGVPDAVMLQALLDFDHYAGALERHVINGYHTAELELARTARDARTQVLRRLLHGDIDSLSDEDITQAGLRPEGLYHCLLSDVTDPVRARALEHQLARFGGVFGLVEGRLAGLSPRLPTAEAIGDDVLVVSAPLAGLHEMRTLHALCVSTLHPGRALELTGLCHLTDLAGETALAAQPALAAVLSRTLLGALDPTDGFHRQLAFTAQSYLDHGQRLDQTAAFLHVHPNTVRYRLGRLEDLTEWSPETSMTGERPRVLDALRWWWALHTWLTGPVPSSRQLS